MYMAELIKTTKHKYNICNTNKTKDINEWLSDYEESVTKYTNYIYSNEIVYNKKITNKSTKTKETKKFIFNLKNNQLEVPSVLNHKTIEFNTKLSARSLSSAITQSCGIVKGIVEHRKQLEDKLIYLKEKGYSTTYTEKLYQKQLTAKQPELKNINAEISSKNASFIYCSDNSFFNGWIKMYCLGDYRKEKNCKSILIPIKFTKYINKLIANGYEMMHSFLICKDHLEIRWKKTITLKTEGSTVGCDTGMLDVVSFSEDNVLDKSLIDNNEYNQSLKVISRKRKGSNAYKRALIHRDNILKSVINHCNFDGIMQLNIENNSTLKFGKKSSNYLGCHAYREIKNKLKNVCKLHGVRVKFTPPTYKSQRCSNTDCGWTQKSNRKGKVFTCKYCEFKIDSDKNSGRNQVIVLPYISWDIRNLKLNRKGFFWKPDGFYDKMGRSLESLV